jgi:hypothetical protein
MWFPIIWKDKPWDHVYLYYILRKKLSTMEEFYASDDPVCLGAKDNLKNIKTCRILLDRLIKDDYIPDAFLEEKDRKKCKRIIDHAELQHKQDIELLFWIMKKHIRGWWD